MNSILAQDIDYMANTFGDVSVFDDKTILITGFAGFLGYELTHFFDALRRDGSGPKKLVLCDNFLLRRPAWVDALSGTGVQVETFDIGKDRVSDAPFFEGVDYVIHMASIASPTFYRQYPIETIDANIWGLRQLLDYYCDKDIDGFLFFSSSEIYGDPDPAKVPLDEEYFGNVSCIGPRSCYDESKRFGETLCYYYAEKYGMPIGVARPFNNFGPGMVLEDRRAPADFAKCVLQKEDIILLSDGSPKRTFCYIADALVGYLKILTLNRFDYFNIGMDQPEISVKELAEIYAAASEKLTGFRPAISCQRSPDRDYLTNNPNRRCPNIDKARKVLGFSPSISVPDGVERYLRFYLEGGAE